MSASLYLLVYSNGDVYITPHAEFLPTLRGGGSSAPNPTEAGTLVGTVRFNSDLTPQKVTTLSGTVSSSLAMTNSITTRGGQSKELT